jgi:hypothetical protein
MDKEQTYFQMEMFIQESIVKENQKEKDNIHGAMVAFMLESSMQVSSTAKVNGKVQKDLKLTCMKEIMQMTRNMVMECFSGHQEIFTRENIKMTKEMGTEK